MAKQVKAIILDLEDVALDIEKGLNWDPSISLDSFQERALKEKTCLWVTQHLFFEFYNIPIINHDYRDMVGEAAFFVLMNNDPQLGKRFTDKCSHILRYWHPSFEANVFISGTSVFLVDTSDKL